MKSFLQVLNEWEFQMLVLLSFMLQILLFFTGNIRLRGPKVLIGIIWIAYLVADMVAVYALGLLSKQEENTKTENYPLGFFWAPFLLCHLGGQDTITAFSLEDNSLWLRHLLNLIIQVGLALYVFWKSTPWRNMQLLLSGIFMLVAGIIKYVERTMALMYGNLQNMSGYSTNKESMLNHPGIEDASYSSIICFSLDSAPIIRHLFAGLRTSQIPESFCAGNWASYARSEEVQLAKLAKLVGVELRILYCDIYTKAAVLRTRSGIILRCISQVAAFVALVVFTVFNKQIYSRADIAITYTLFAGYFFLEVCAMFVMVIVSPWTWAWLKGKKYSDRLTRMSWKLVSSDIIGWPENKPLWSNSLGQYDFLSYLGYKEKLSSRSEQAVRKIAKSVGKLFWLSKLLDTKYDEVDNDITENFVKACNEIGPSVWQDAKTRQWQHFSWFLRHMQAYDFSSVVLHLHISTIIHLSEASVDVETAGIVAVCRKLSNYMMYLLVTHPVMLQVTATSAESVLKGLSQKIRQNSSMDNHVILQNLKKFLSEEDKNLSLPEPSKETLEEMRDVWVRIILYVAGTSRPETHVTQLSRGGEFLTFIWLLMAHLNLGATSAFPVNLTSPSTIFGPTPDLRVYAFDFRHRE